MKLLVKKSILLSIIIAFSSCSKEEEGLVVYTNSVHFNSAKDSLNFFIASDNWKASVSENATSWLSLADGVSEKDKNKKTLLINVKENISIKPREAVITVKGAGKQKDVYVKQKGSTPILNVNFSGEKLQVGKKGGDVTFSVESNFEYKIQIPADIKWIKEKSVTKNGNKTEFVYSVSESSVDKREVELLIKETDGDNSETLTIYQQKVYLFVEITSGKASNFQPRSGNEGPIELSFDNDLNTFYHSSWNDTKFPIELDYTFANESEIAKLEYTPRPSGGDNGLLGKVEIWRMTNDGKFEKIKDYDFEQKRGVVEVEFSPVKTKTMRIIIKSGKNNFASCSEMKFYSEG